MYKRLISQKIKDFEKETGRLGMSSRKMGSSDEYLTPEVN
jgi:hypothetical protein